MKIYPSNLNHIRFTKPTNEEIQEKYNFPCSITVLNQSLSTSEVFYYDGEGNEFPQGRFNIPSDYLFQKALLKTDTAPTIKGLYPLSETGIYTNLGGINAPIGKLNFASFDGTTWKLIAVEILNSVVLDEQIKEMLLSESYMPQSATYKDGIINSPFNIIWANGATGAITVTRNTDGLVTNISATHIKDSITKTITAVITRNTDGNATNITISII